MEFGSQPLPLRFPPREPSVVRLTTSFISYHLDTQSVLPTTATVPNSIVPKTVETSLHTLFCVVSFYQQVELELDDNFFLRCFQPGHDGQPGVEAVVQDFIGGLMLETWHLELFATPTSLVAHLQSTKNPVPPTMFQIG